MRFGIFDLISLVGTLMFAFPVGNFGVTRLLAGEIVMGVALLVVAVAMVAIPQYFMDPRTIVAKLINGVLPGKTQNEESTATEAERQSEVDDH